MDLSKARDYVYAHARPLDLARWKFHFENGSQADVLTCLLAFQNPDGGFGHALEPDCLNPHSSPIQTWRAMEILTEIGLDDRMHPMIRKIIRYLQSGDGFDEKAAQWRFQVPTNNDYPHAIWWEFHADKLTFKYNPSAYLAGFILRYGDTQSSLYEKARKMAQQAFDFLKKTETLDGDSLRCFIGLYTFLSQEKMPAVLPLPELKRLIVSKIDKEICTDPSKYGVEYVTLPSKFFPDKSAPFIEGHEALIQKEIDVLPSLQKEDGAMDIYWRWGTDYPEFETARTWWRSDLTIRSFVFYRNFG